MNKKLKPLVTPLLKIMSEIRLLFPIKLLKWKSFLYNIPIKLDWDLKMKITIRIKISIHCLKRYSE